MASILPLPNLGNTPSFEALYTSEAGAVRPARAANARAILEAFWSASCVVAAEDSAREQGRVMLRYEAPTRRARAQQTIDLRLSSSEGYSTSDSSFVLCEVFQQDNVEQGLRTSYLIVQSFERASAASELVKSNQRVAVFLQPTDGMYFEAMGNAVALYDYSYKLTPLPVLTGTGAVARTCPGV